MRIFLAINLPDDVRRAVWHAAATLREAGDSVRWVDESRIHLTVKFIGEVQQPDVDQLAAAMQSIARTHAAHAVSLKTVGAFPNFRRPRVLWMGIEPEPRLELLHHDVEVACAALGHELDGRPYRPHLTLARVPAPLDALALKRMRAAAKRIRFTDEFFARSIDVMQSVPGPRGSKYELLASAPLKGG